MYKNEDKTDYDFVVIGSGFGGATVALRLAEAGRSVLILERGRAFRGKNLQFENFKNSMPFPEPGENHYFWGRQLLNPFRQRLGLYELHNFSNLQGLTAAGLGGGSLIWANVVVRASEQAFAKNWPDDINLDSLEPYYRLASAYLRPKKIPGLVPGQAQNAAPKIERARLHRLAAERLGLSWQAVDLAVNFADEKNAEYNGFGKVRQLGCNFCGLCSAGCPQNAKNSCDLTYIAAALAKGAELATLTEATAIEALDNGAYLIHARVYEADGRLSCKLRIKARRLILACGSFGTTKLLLKSREAGLLPALSPALGSRFSINGNVLSAAFKAGGSGRHNNGPAISSVIDFGDHAVEDIANPVFAAGMVGGSQWSRAYYFLRSYLGFKMSAAQIAALTEDLLVYVGVGMDSSSGRLRLNALGNLSVDWPGLKNEAAIQAQHRAQKAIAGALGREYVPDVFSTFNRQFTYHPLGACPMADSPASGVVDSYGEVFNYPGLYIADGSVIPTSLGRNPSFTICALAERSAARLIETKTA